jgi:hypothetical protein
MAIIFAIVGAVVWVSGVVQAMPVLHQYYAHGGKLMDIGELLAIFAGVAAFNHRWQCVRRDTKPQQD